MVQLHRGKRGVGNAHFVTSKKAGKKESLILSTQAMLPRRLLRGVEKSGVGRSLFRKAFVMYLNEGAEEEYKKRHDDLWPDLEAALKEGGAHNYSIFLEPSTRQLFAYVEIESEEKWAGVAKTDACQRWWAYMGDIMETNPDSSPKADELREVFHLE